MVMFFRDLLLLAVFVIGLTAFMGILAHWFSLKVFGGRSVFKFVDHSKSFQSNWSNVQRRNR
ncbi:MULTISPECIES: hypothetical protein [unclassified Fictibacillus]|uniref:hypothetical protein n=1 Tax=unclassified Fictibacillus TaxID=2644029 RepID=UPI000780BADD|nr:MULTISPECIES: hypothetical protein [unclassified Fictibacillus]UZJ77383.1 hypothetical protein OKX00_14480 [Fictibacillus sp. KU28468]SFE07538.1 hypothetical protein SAMN05428981_103356 [Bacillus sp. OV194]